MTGQASLPLADQNRTLVNRIYDHVLVGEFEALSPFLDGSFHIVEADGLPYGGTYHGLDGMKQLMARIGECWGESSGTIETVIADKDHVAAVLTLSGQDLQGAPTSVRICEVWHIKDGKALSVHPFYWDTFAVRSMVAGVTV